MTVRDGNTGGDAGWNPGLGIRFGDQVQVGAWVGGVRLESTQRFGWVSARKTWGSGIMASVT